MSDKDSSKNLVSINSICSLLDFSGEGVVGFLNNLVISDLKDLDNNEFNYTALCNPKGRIIASLWIKIISNQQILMICPVNMLEELNLFFNQRKFRLKISISPAINIIVLDGKQQIISLNSTNENIALDNDNVESGFYTYLFKQNLPWIDKSNTEKFIPQHVNLDQHKNIMSFTKGCYPGQEIIARLKFLGKIKKRMCLLKNTNKQILEEQSEKLKLVSPVIYSHLDNHHYLQAIKLSN